MARVFDVPIELIRTYFDERPEEYAEATSRAAHRLQADNGEIATASIEYSGDVLIQKHGVFVLAARSLGYAGYPCYFESPADEEIAAELFRDVRDR